MKDNVLKWIGGKHTLGEFIIKLMPPHKEYIEVFMGGGNIFLQKPLATVNVVNDLNNNLINMYKVINDEKKKEALKMLFDHVPYGRAFFEYFLSIYKDPMRWAQSEQIFRAFAYIYLNRVSFNGQGQTYARRNDSVVLYSLDQVIDKMYRKFQSGKTVFERLPFDELLAEVEWKENVPKIGLLKYDRQDCFLYLDPPYWVTTQAVGSGYYEKVMSTKEHPLLRDILVKHKRARWLLSYDDVPEVRHLYGLPLDKDSESLRSNKYEGVMAILTPLTYQSSGSLVDGEQIFKRELLIANYNLEIVNTLFE
jgi:DNA adenine methylase